MSRQAIAGPVRLVLAAALAITGVVALGSTSPTASAITTGNATVECRSAGFDFGVKLEEDSPGTYTYDTAGKWDPKGLALDLEVTIDDSKNFSYTASPATAAVLVKAGPGYDVFPASTGGGFALTRGFGISHITFCYNQGTPESLTVTKTVTTSYDRVHRWTLGKSVDSGEVVLEEDESGTVNWTVEVGYGGMADANHTVSGTVTVTNTGASPAAVTTLTDTMTIDETTVDVPLDCPVDLAQGPAFLEPSSTLVCTYTVPVDGQVTGTNKASATSFTNVTYGSAPVEITWGYPASVLDETVELTDVSDVNGTPDPTSFTAPAGGKLEYSNTFKWSDYDLPADCGTHTYDNVATLAIDAADDLTDTESVDVKVICDTDVQIEKTHGDLDYDPEGDADAVSPGEQYDYILTVTNNGDNIATNVIVTDNVPARLQVVNVAVPAGWTDESVGNAIRATTPTLAVGVPVDIVVTVELLPAAMPAVTVIGEGDDAPTITVPPIEALENNACVDADVNSDGSNDCDDDEVPVDDIVAVVYARCVNEAPYLGFQVATSSGLAGQPITMTWTANQATPETDPQEIVIENLASGAAQEIEWPGAEFSPDGISIDFPGWRRLVESDYDAVTGELLPGSEVYNGLIRDTAEADEAWRYDTNVNFSVNPEIGATISYPEETPDCEADRTTELTIDKSASVSSTTAGGSFEYDIVVENVSLNGAAAPVTLSDPIPSNLRVDAITTSTTDFPRWVDCEVTGQDVDGYGGTLNCDLFGSLFMGETAPVVTLDVTVDPDASSGTITNTATVAWALFDDPEDTGTDDDSVPVTVGALPVDVGIVKSHTGVPGGTVAPGESFQYALDVTNHSQSTATNVVVTDQIPSRLTVTNVAVPAGWTNASSGNAVKATTTSMAAGATAKIVVTVRLAAAPLAAPTSIEDGEPAPQISVPPLQTLTNTACVAATADSNPANNCDDDTVQVDDIVAVVYVRCVNDAPLMGYSVQTSSGLAGLPITLTWTPNAANASTVPAQLVFNLQPGDSDEVAWPGAAFSPEGISIDFPGWRLIEESDYVNGVIPASAIIYNGLIRDTAELDEAWRGATTLTFSINPEISFTASYPAATPECAPERDTDLVIEKLASQPSVRQGDPFQYTIEVTNVSDSGAADNVVLTDPIPGNIKVDTITTSTTAFPRWTNCAVTGKAANGYGGTLRCELFGPLMMGESAPVVVLGSTLSPTAPIGSTTNTAVVEWTLADVPDQSGTANDSAVIAVIGVNSQPPVPTAPTLPPTGSGLSGTLGQLAAIVMGAGALMFLVARRRNTTS